MNKFNLTFSGEIIAGHDLAQVKLRFANLFEIDDPVRLERFFSGETVILRRNLERKAAAQCYHELLQLGALATLVKITDTEADAAKIPTKPSSPVKATGNVRRPAAARESERPPRSRANEKTWAVSKAASIDTRYGKSNRTSAASGKPSAWQRDGVDIAAGIKARKLELHRQVAEKQASEEAAQAERQRLTAEATARRQAEALERQRLAEEEAARLQAQRDRAAAEEAARQQAIAAEAALKAAEEAQRLAEEQARIRALEAEEEARREAAEEESRRKAAEEAERKRRQEELAARKAQAAAARKAEQEEKKRRDAEEKARRKAALEEKKRQAAAEAARRKVELEEQRRQAAAAAARRKAEREEQKRQAAETARRKAELEEQQRLDAEEAARQRAELEELQRREAEEESRLQAELAAIKLREAEEAQRLQAELEVQARQAAAQAAAQAARIKAEAQKQQEEAQQKSAERRRAIAEALAARQARQAERRRQADADEPQVQPVAQAPQGVREGVHELPPPSPARRAKPRIRTALQVPPRNSLQDAQTTTPEPRKRQPGEPNVYKLRPFRNTEDVRTRAVLARRRARKGYTLGILALAALLILAGSFLQRTVAPAAPGARAIAVDPQSGPLLLAQDALLFHDRAGIGTGVKPLQTLGLEALDPPLLFDDNAALMAMGTRSIDQDSSDEGARQLLRCEAPLEQCAPFSPELADSTIDAFVVNPVDGSVLLADRSIGLLLKSDRDGAIVARADAVFAEQLVMRLHTGLLLMNSATAPAVSVLRYENNAFGQQLDEILLLPPGVEDLDKLRVGDFIWSSGHWWVSLQHPESGNAGVYRFDEEWNFIDKVSLPATAGTLQLVSWGDKVLVNDPQQLAIARISALGAVEAPFVSSQLEKVSAEQARRAFLVNLASRGALLLCALGAVLGIGLGYLQSRRALVYQARREKGAEPLDEHVTDLQWIDPAANRQTQLRRRMASYCAVALGALLFAVASNVSVWQLAALLLALSGPAVALLLQSRGPIGHIGVLGDRLVLVDHRGTYHLAGGSRIQHRGPFLCIDDVVVYCGGRLLPAFSIPQVQQLVSPFARGGVRVDRDTIAVKLLQSRHPIAAAVIAIAAALAAACALLYLQEMA